MSFSNSDDDRVPEDPEKVLLKECIAAYEILLINRSRSQNWQENMNRDSEQVKAVVDRLIEHEQMEGQISNINDLIAAVFLEENSTDNPAATNKYPPLDHGNVKAVTEHMKKLIQGYRAIFDDYYGSQETMPERDQVRQQRMSYVRAKINGNK